MVPGGVDRVTARRVGPRSWRSRTAFFGTVRLVEQDDERFLAWAKQPYACIIFNLHTVRGAIRLKESIHSFPNFCGLNRI